MPNPGEQFIHSRDSKLHTTPPVEHEQKRRKRKKASLEILQKPTNKEKEKKKEEEKKESLETSHKPAEKLKAWFEVLEKTHLSHSEDPQVMQRIKEYYHQEHVIKPEDIPEAYFDNQRRLAREQGHGDIEITGEMREQLTEVILSDQKSTLDNWLDYLTSPDSSSFPIWAKYWAFTGMLKLSTFDKEKHAFGKRDKDTVAPFADLNREALAYVVDAVVKKAEGKDIPDQIDNEEFQKLLQGANFGKLYAYAIEEVTPTEESELLTTKGEWVKYDQGSDHMPLVESLQGHGTGWCTAGENTAKKQLAGGDFYVYYSYDKDGQPIIPRVAIRMDGKAKIGEVRGISHEQNLDPYINDVVEEKLDEFGPEGELYQKKVEDMKRLTEIDNRHKKRKELSKDDLKFLYEIDDKIKGFGYQEDPRIKEILESRDIKGDISNVLKISKDQISLTSKEALSGNIKFHYGDLDLDSLTSAEHLTLPKSIGRSLLLSSLPKEEKEKLRQKYPQFRDKIQ